MPPPLVPNPPLGLLAVRVDPPRNSLPLGQHSLGSVSEFLASAKSRSASIVLPRAS
jgi:hypothetical protein